MAWLREPLCDKNGSRTRHSRRLERSNPDRRVNPFLPEPLSTRSLTKTLGHTHRHELTLRRCYRDRKRKTAAWKSAVAGSGKESKKPFQADCWSLLCHSRHSCLGRDRLDPRPVQVGVSAIRMPTWQAGLLPGRAGLDGASLSQKGSIPAAREITLMGWPIPCHGLNTVGQP